MPGMPGNVAKGPIMRKLDEKVNADPGSFLEAYLQIKAAPPESRMTLMMNFGQRSKRIFAGRDRSHIEEHWMGRRDRHRAWFRHIVPLDGVFLDALIHVLKLCIFEEARFQSTGRLSFDAGGPHGACIRRDDGRWDADGFAVADVIQAYGQLSPPNTVRLRISGVEDDRIDVTNEDGSPAVLANESDRSAACGVTRAQARPLDTYWVCAGSHFELVSTLSPQQVTFLILTPSPPFTRHEGNFMGDENIWVTKRLSSPGERHNPPLRETATVRLCDQDWD